MWCWILGMWFVDVEGIGRDQARSQKEEFHVVLY